MKNLAKTTAIFALAAAAAGCGRVTENEVVVVMNKGAFKEVVTEPTLYCVPMCSPFTDRIYFKTFKDTFTLSSGQGANAGGGQQQQQPETTSRQIFLRSSDDKFIESVSVSVSYEVTKSPQTVKLVTEFRADRSNSEENAVLIRDDLQILLTQPLVNVIRGYEALEIQDKGQEIGDKLVEALQAAVDRNLEIKEGELSPIKIRAVLLGGVKFDPETENLLKQKIFAREQSDIAKEASAAAAEQAKAAAAQADVTAQIASRIQNAVGNNSSQTASLVCLDMQRQKLLPAGTQCFGIGVK